MRWLAVGLMIAVVSPALARDKFKTARVMTATSLDGRYRAVVRPMRAAYCGPDGQGNTDNALHAMDVTDTRTGASAGYYMGAYSGGGLGAKYDERTVTYGSPKFSPDSRSVYFVGRDTLCETGGWLDNPGVFRIDLQEERPLPAHFVAEGRLIAIVRTGPRAGFLFVEQRGKHGGVDPVALFSPDGARLLTVPGSEQRGRAAIKPWLKAQGWTAY